MRHRRWSRHRLCLSGEVSASPNPHSNRPNNSEMHYEVVGGESTTKAAHDKDLLQAAFFDRPMSCIPGTMLIFRCV